MEERHSGGVWNCAECFYFRVLRQIAPAMPTTPAPASAKTEGSGTITLRLNAVLVKICAEAIEQSKSTPPTRVIKRPLNIRILRSV